jgi:hypothetical protein
MLGRFHRETVFDYIFEGEIKLFVVLYVRDDHPQLKQFFLCVAFSGHAGVEAQGE